jgi:HEAT repeat protein
MICDTRKLEAETENLLKRLKGCLKSEETLERIDALEILGQFFQEENQSIFLDALDENDELIQIVALETLTNMDNKKFLPEIKRKLNSDSWLIRAYAIEAIGKYYDIESKDTLENMISNADEEEKPRLYYSLIKLDEKSYYKNLYAALNHSFYRVRIATSNLLYDLCDELNKREILKSLEDRLSIETEKSVLDTLQGIIQDIKTY